MMTACTIRRVQEQDLDEIALLEKQIFSEPWTKDSFLEAMARRGNIFLVATVEEKIAAYGLLYGMLDEGEIPTIATNPIYRYRGIGEQLLLQLLQEAESQAIHHIFLEVRQSNLPAQNLYRKCGFKIVGQRKQFYRFPTEDAFVMAYYIEEQH